MQEAAAREAALTAAEEAAGTKRAETLLVVTGPANTPASDDTADDTTTPPKMRSRAPTIVVERVSSDTSYGEDPGPDGSIERKEAWKMRQADAVPDVVRVVGKDEVAASGGEAVEVGLGVKGAVGGLSP